MKDYGASVKAAIDKVAARIEALSYKKDVQWTFPQLIAAGDYKELYKIEPRIVDFFKKATKRAVQIAQDELKVQLDAEIIALNLIDTGNLQSSLQISTKYNLIQVTYDAPYADLLHYGGYIRPYGNPNAKKVYIPGRPWVENVLNAYDFGDAFMRALEQTT